MTNIENYLRLLVAAFMGVSIWYTALNYTEIFAIAMACIFSVLIVWVSYEQWDD